MDWGGGINITLETMALWEKMNYFFWFFGFLGGREGLVVQSIGIGFYLLGSVPFYLLVL